MSRSLKKQAHQARTADDEQFDQQHYLDETEADKIQDRLERFINPSLPVESHLRFDPVERTPKWEELVYEVEKECDRRLKGEPRGMGFCFSYWSTKKAVLKKYGIHHGMKRSLRICLTPFSEKRRFSARTTGEAII